jgi:hypothetical protein
MEQAALFEGGGKARKSRLPGGWAPDPRARGAYGNLAWRSPSHPNVVIRHCGHPTALWPYYVEAPQLVGTPIVTYGRLLTAILAVENGEAFENTPGAAGGKAGLHPTPHQSPLAAPQPEASDA